jgi:HSP20 family protein
MGRFFEAFEPVQSWRAQRHFPAINLYDARDSYLLTAELPGVEPGGLDLSLTGETLTLRGERKKPEGVSDESYRRQERPFGRWSRTVTLPERIDGTKVSAQFSQGVLSVTLPKAEDARPRHIPVSTKPA